MAIATINPATGQLVARRESLSAREIERKLAAAEAAFRVLRDWTFEQRGACLRRTADLLESGKRDLARLAVLEMGKPIRQAIAEVEKCAWACRYYAEHGARHLVDEVIETDARRSLVRYEPLGVILAVMPWNFPYWQVFRFAAPALMAGNAALLKHASNVPQVALAIEDLFARSGFPAGAFATLLIDAGRVEEIIRDDRIRAVTLTGSEPAGRAVAAAAGRAIKKTVLELGGSDPFIVMPSADLSQAAAVATQARVQNNGQSCIAAKRFIVAHTVADAFERELVARFASLRVGDPMDETTDVGPLATRAGLEELERQVASLVEAGGTVLVGGRRLDGEGYFYAPTIVTGVSPDAPAAQEEIFGPVALLFRVADAREAVAVANATRFGLGASAWTNDPHEQDLFITGLEAGAVFINGMVKSDPRLPFGGVKASGYGRELSVFGIREFVNVKTVWIGPAHAG
jgi:succinate-semialdehyde dehydrogenase/glutarate-semialdehyde dehydrogenase